MAKHIVIVEDDPDQRSNYADAITNKGYQVSAYGNREEALAAVICNEQSGVKNVSITLNQFSSSSNANLGQNLVNCSASLT